MMWTCNIFLKCGVNSKASLYTAPFIRQQLSCSRNISNSSPLQTCVLSAHRSIMRTSLHVQKHHPLKRFFHVSKCFQSDVPQSLAKDVILFKYDNMKLFKLITLFGIVNFAMFISVSLNLYAIITDQVKNDDKQSEFDSESNERSSFSSSNPTSLYSVENNSQAPSENSTDAENSSEPIPASTLQIALCGVTFALGYFILGATWIYCNHVIRYLVLHKCGKKVTVVTHGVFAKNRYSTWDVEKVTVRGNRVVSSAVLLNAKGKRIAYILDKNGEYTNPKLFDMTVGVPRDLRN